MKAITLNDVIKKNLKDPEFRKLYEKEQLINAIAQMVLQMRKNAGLTPEFDSIYIKEGFGVGISGFAAM
jgi:hypothetical protein